MEREISLQDLYQHPLVAEIINENKQLRATLSEKPEVKDLNDIPLPYTIKRHVLINEGVHNGVFYSAQMLRLALSQHEGLSLFLDHHQNDQGGTALTWCGSIINPSWSEADKGIVGDVDIVDPKTAIALAYGAKFGISATVDLDTIKKEDGSEVANDPVFKSYSIVLDPAVRQTMLNENDASKSEEIKKEGEEKKMTDELDIKSDLKPAMEKVDDAIRRASAMKDTSLLATLQQAKAILSKLAGTEYPYPKPGAMEALEGKMAALEQIVTEKMKPSETPSQPLKDEALEAVLNVDRELVGKFEQMEQAISGLQHPAEPEAKPAPETPNLELDAALKENETMKAQLEAIEHDKLVVRSDGILNKELELGLILAADSDARRKELEAMDSASLDAVETNLDKTLKILETTPSIEDSTPETPTPTTDRKELSKDKEKEIELASNQKLLNLMMKEQTEGHISLGGY